MSFIESYKRLEKLCGEVLRDNRCLSAYIEEMEDTPRGVFLVRSWSDDFKCLKHYRWLRNRIAHDPGCTEDNMCTEADVLWLDDFYDRIMHQTDPLALYRKATQPKAQPPIQKPTQKSQPPIRQPAPTPVPPSATRHSSYGCILTLVAVLGVAAIVAVVYSLYHLL